jgi:hypothetical protein
MASGMANSFAWTLVGSLLALALLLGLPTLISVVWISEAPGGLGIRRRILALDIAYLVLLFYAAYLHVLYGFGDSVPWLKYSLHAIWFATLGSVAISIKGVNDWKDESRWTEGWRLWYWARPASGFIIGSVTYLLLLVASANQPSLAAVAIVSFLFGTQETRFFTFLSKVAGLVLDTPADPTTLTISDVRPRHGPIGTVSVITGTSFDPNATFWLGGTQIAVLAIAKDGQSAAATIPAMSDGKFSLLVQNPDGSAFVFKNAFDVTV